MFIMTSVPLDAKLVGANPKQGVEYWWLDGDTSDTVLRQTRKYQRCDHLPLRLCPSIKAQECLLS